MAQPITITGFADSDGRRRAQLSCGHLGEPATERTVIGAERKCAECEAAGPALQHPSSLALREGKPEPGTVRLEVPEHGRIELTVMALLAEALEMLGDDEAAKRRVVQWLASLCADESP